MTSNLEAIVKGNASEGDKDRKKDKVEGEIQRKREKRSCVCDRFFFFFLLYSLLLNNIRGG